ncbi:hypothetical protein I656_04109 [Geobacillus sp. WSUCF1]|nr:hypothetical protein I656_04109 [Geobacillus sp. WSUCF1]
MLCLSFISLLNRCFPFSASIHFFFANGKIHAIMHLFYPRDKEV